MLKTTNRIIGNYEIKENKLYHQENGQIIHLRERSAKTRGNKPKYFLAVHKPTYEYISSLYPKSIATAEVEDRQIASIRLYELDYKGYKYKLAISGSEAKIERV